MKILILTTAIVALAITSQAHSGPLTEAQLNEACGPLPQVYKECGLADDKCCAAALARTDSVVECRLRVLLRDALTPKILAPVQWPSEG